MTVNAGQPIPEVKRVVNSYMVMFVYGVLITLLACFMARVFNTFHPLAYMWVRLLEYIGYICWAASLGTLGPQAWVANSSTAKFDKKLTDILSLIGIFSFVMARELEPFS